MHIGIDATAMPPQPVGAGQYMIHLIRALVTLPGNERYRIYVQPHGRDLIGLPENERLKFQLVPSHSPFARLVWEQAQFPGLLRHSGLDLLHSLHYTMPLSHPLPQVVTLHDLTYFVYPQYHILPKRYFFRNFIRLSGRKAERLVAVSESTRQDAIRLAGLAAEKIISAPLGVTAEFQPIRDLQRLQPIKEKYRLPSRFILFVGLLEPRKNLITLLHAYRHIYQQIGDVRLVIVGRQGWKMRQTRQLLDSLALTPYVHFTGYVEQQDLPAIYNLADVFVYPSLYEGFGLPVLEALACGVPVITSEVSSMPEIAGETALYFPPTDDLALAQVLLELLQDEEQRKALSIAGPKRAARFTWEETARRTRLAYAQALS
jgi:glycosyltransferase involved in cell wall biosynthesis